MVLLDVINVEAKSDGTLVLVFENQEKRLFDMKPYLSRQPCVKLRERGLFMKASVALGTVVWPENIDIAPETLWEESQPV